MVGLEDAILLATQAHHGQRRYNDTPYVLHPLRMMLRLEQTLTAQGWPRAAVEQAMTVAVLHDVVEDTATTLDDLRAAGYAAEVITAVDALTRRKDESYEAFIVRIKPNALARTVKRADLWDNMNLLGLKAISDHDADRLRRYRAAWDTLAADGGSGG